MDGIELDRAIGELRETFLPYYKAEYAMILFDEMRSAGVDPKIEGFKDCVICTADGPENGSCIQVDASSVPSGVRRLWYQWKTGNAVVEKR